MAPSLTGLLGDTGSALNFVETFNLTHWPNNVNPLYVKTPFMAQEHDGDLYHYFINEEDKAAADKGSEVDHSFYGLIEWGGLARHLTTRGVSRIGIKQFPQIGAVGFYKNLYTNKTSVLAPIHVDQPTYDPPTLSVSPTGTQMHIVLTPPEGVTYTVYRVVFRDECFATEYILYETDTYVDNPETNATYYVTAIGYNEDTHIVSGESNEEVVTVSNGRVGWRPAPTNLRLADLADVDLVSLLNNQGLFYNSNTQKWENGAAATSLEELTDVQLSTPADKQVLKYQESSHKWINATGGGGGGGSSPVALVQSIPVYQAFGTPYTWTAPITSGLCLIFVMHRKEITMSSEWTLLYKSPGNPTYTGQYVSVYYKRFTSANLSYTVANADESSSTWPVNIHVFKCSGTPSIYMPAQSTSQQHITLVKNTSNLVIWARHEVWWSDTYSWNFTPGFGGIWNTSTGGRLCTSIDNSLGMSLDIYPSTNLSNYYGEYLGIEIIPDPLEMSLNDLSDVDINNPQTGHKLYYDTTSASWINQE